MLPRVRHVAGVQQQLHPMNNESEDTMIALPNSIIHGNCIDVMQAMSAGGVDFILTDPPYLARYKDRDGRKVQNDDNTAWLTRSFAQMFRVLRNDAFAISFYG